jgi:hypothetical protein
VLRLQCLTWGRVVGSGLDPESMGFVDPDPCQLKEAHKEVFTSFAKIFEVFL